jgi:hypothetical protein
VSHAKEFGVTIKNHDMCTSTTEKDQI